MKMLDGFFRKAREQADVECSFDFGAFKEYTEIFEEDLETDRFYSEELFRLKRDHAKAYVPVVIFVIWEIVLLMAWFFNPKAIHFPIMVAILGVVIVFYGIFLFTRRRALHTPGTGVLGLQRGVILCKTRVFVDPASSMTGGVLMGNRRGRYANQKPVWFASVFFPDNQTFIRNVHCPGGGFREVLEVGDTVMVYKLKGDSFADILPTRHVAVPPDLLSRAEEVRKQAEYDASGANGNIETVYEEPVKARKGKLVLIVLLVVLLPMLVTGLFTIAVMVYFFLKLG
ncbi:MAG: hypothetical protein PHP22_09380 [Oscillospiraceae bacterium]|nr:hypothetical protein [Oscillospiraceae bacterium]